jgi:uncharacterized coiled-coil protein SlyX
MTPAERIAELEAVVEQQREQIAALLERVHDLEARLAKDSLYYEGSSVTI